MEDFGKLYTVGDIVSLTSLTDRTIRNHLRSGALQGRKIGGQWRFTTEDIKRFMNRGEVVTTLEKEQKRMVHDFMDGIGADGAGETRVCTVADLYLPQQEARKKSEELCELVNATRGEKNLQYRYSYARAEGRARFLLLASPKFLKQALDILEQ